MLRYYTYYSVGGYKDLYLGNSTMNQDATYFLPLLEIQRKRAESSGDKIELDAVAHKETLPKILHVTQRNTCDMPKVASRLISHGGYKLIFLNDSKDRSILVLRDIASENQDESGRAIPFLMMVTADTTADSALLLRIAAYWSNHIAEVSQRIATFITYEKDLNGTRFALHDFNEWLLTTKADFPVVETTKGDVRIDDFESMMLLSSGLSLSVIKKELNLPEKGVRIIPTNLVLPLDNPSKAKNMLARAHAEAVLLRKRKMMYCAIGGAIAIGIIAYVISIKH